MVQCSTPQFHLKQFTMASSRVLQQPIFAFYWQNSPQKAMYLAFVIQLIFPSCCSLPHMSFFDVEQVIFGKGKSTASRTHSITGSSLIVENGDEHEEILDEDTHTWLDDKIDNMAGDSTFDAEEDIDLDVPELTKILADDPPQGSVLKGKKGENVVACIDDTNDADGEWVWK
ncbi:hypothetical protein EV702DRAFT_1071222 [Suillus placidus]|uniref:Uncharacterized protein n=1 Tax=Suillus placidus TaxID=48579 RepID=A0A9P7D7L1_9AGAM|nr:hypothetical protein EV702DRAFT_1071222 [Suillus placidus]